MRLLLSLTLCALALSVGWGFRGDYGHEAGAMVPGALAALAVCLTCGRPDWWRRASLLALLGAIGWAFGGSMSYGRVIGYTATDSFADVAYGYACLFAIGAIWGGIGVSVLALGVTRPRAELERFAGPMVAFYLALLALNLSGATRWLNRELPLYDTDWVAATAALAVAGLYALLVPHARRACALIALLAGGWWAAFGLLTLGLGLRMTPPRGDNWAGCLGVLLALLAWLMTTRNRAALFLLGHGLLAGGIGFAGGDFVQMLGRAQVGPMAAEGPLHGLDYWKWMEQLFGLVMGLGVGLGFARAGARLSPVENDDRRGALHWVALLFLLVAMMWENLFKNVRTWSRRNLLSEGLLGIEPWGWFLAIGVFVSIAIVAAIVQHQRGRLALTATMGAFGRAQLLFLLLLWVPVIAALLQALPGIGRKGLLFVHATFWLTATAATLMTVCLTAEARPTSDWPPEDSRWLPGWKAIALTVLVPALVLLLAWLTVTSHEGPLPGSHRRFEP